MGEYSPVSYDGVRVFELRVPRYLVIVTELDCFCSLEALPDSSAMDEEYRQARSVTDPSRDLEAGHAFSIFMTYTSAMVRFDRGDYTLSG